MGSMINDSVQSKLPKSYKQSKLCFSAGKLIISKDFTNSSDSDHQETMFSLGDMNNPFLSKYDNLLKGNDRQQLCQYKNAVENVQVSHSNTFYNLNCYEQTTKSELTMKKLRYKNLLPSPYNTVRKNKLTNAKKISANQMLLDAGQKKFGVIQCPVCKFIYHVSDPGDEAIHQNYHNAQHILTFRGWKDERVISKFEYGRIIHVKPNDPVTWKKRINLLLDFINKDLGYFDIVMNTNNIQVFLFIKSRLIVGCLVAESASVGRKMLTVNSGFDFCSEETYPIKCGVLRIWVSEAHRRQKIATLLMDSLKKNFQPECVLTNMNIAFSSPTELGKKFAIRYFNTANFLVYAV